MSAAASDENILRRVGVGRPRGVVLGNELQLMQPTSRLRPHESPRPRSVPVMGNAAKLIPIRYRYRQTRRDAGLEDNIDPTRLRAFFSSKIKSICRVYAGALSFKALSRKRNGVCRKAIGGWGLPSKQFKSILTIGNSLTMTSDI